MYKVFFKDRIVFFTNDFPGAIKNNDGLFYKYGNPDALKAIIKAFKYLDSVREFYLVHHDIELIWKEFCTSFKRIDAAGGVVRNNKGEILVIKRNGIWDLPKGKLDKGEDFETAALREVSEECGINNLILESKIISTYHTYDLDSKEILKKTEWFSMLYKGEETPVPQISENISSVMWLNPDEISYISGNTYRSLMEVFTASNLI